MKVSFALLSTMAALVVASPAPSDAMIKRGLDLVKKQDQCYGCIDNCKEIGGLGDAACKVVFCAIQCVLTDG